jgi:hypothetical protein
MIAAKPSAVPKSPINDTADHTVQTAPAIAHQKAFLRRARYPPAIAITAVTIANVRETASIVVEAPVSDM